MIFSRLDKMHRSSISFQYGIQTNVSFSEKFFVVHWTWLNLTWKLFSVRETFNYFRGILATQEKSERALRITTHAINLNSNNYSVWDYRRQILKAIKYDLQKELFFVDYLIKESPGNHLIWHHRRLIANSCLSFVNLQNELDLTEIVLKDYSKCYNAWEHRQWIIDTFKYSSSGLPRQELEFTKNLIQDDLRNNSAWNQRFFILKKLGTADFELIKQEIDFALDCLVKVLDNETAWTYLKGLLKHFGEKNLRQLQKVSGNLIS